MYCIEKDQYQFQLIKEFLMINTIIAIFLNYIEDQILENY